MNGEREKGEYKVKYTMHRIFGSNYQNGKEYYIVKNSWGETNDYKGYLFMTKEYVKLKSTAIMVNKAAVPNDLAKKMSI